MVPVEEGAKGDCQREALLDFPIALPPVEEDVAVDLRLTEQRLEQLEVAVVLLVYVNRFLAVAAFFKAIVVFLELADDALVPMATLDADEEVVAAELDGRRLRRCLL